MWRGRCRLRARWASLLACLLCAATARAQDITWTDNGDGTHVFDDSFGFDATEYSFVSKFTRGETVAVAEADRLGAAVSIDGDTLAVGRPHHFDNQEYRGEVWMYARDTPGNRTSSWSLIQIVRAPDGSSDGDYFAGSLDLDGDTLVVGAAQASPHGVEDDAGSAYVFTRSTAGVPSSLWTFRQKLQSPTRLAGDHFGFAVAVDGDVVIAGAPNRDQSADGNQVVDSSMSGQNIGAVFVFARATPGDRTSEFVLLDRLENPYPRDDDGFGATVAVDGDVLVATTAAEMTFNRDTDSQFCPIAYVFVRTEPGVTHSRWAGQAFLKLDACDARTRHLKPVAVYGDVIVVGAPDHDHVEVDSDGVSTTHYEAGHAYVFTRDLGGDVNGNWNHWNVAETLNAEVFSEGDNFGWSVGVWNETIAVGAPSKDEHETWNEGVDRDSTGDENHGAVYLFQQSYSDNSDGSTSLTWVMVVRFVPSGDDTNGGEFGASLAVHRDGLAVGAENDDGVAGAAYVFALPEVIDPTPAAPTTNATDATANATNATAPVGSLGPAPGSKNKDDAIGLTNVRFMASTIASFVLAAPFSFLAVCAIFFKPWLRRKLLDCGWKNLADTIVPDWKSDVRLMKIEVSELQAHVKAHSFPRKKDVRPILMANELKMEQPGDAAGMTSRSKTGATTMGLLAGETVAVNSMFPGGAAVGVPKKVASAMAKEVKELATLNHPNLRMVKGAVPEKGVVVMEHCRGGSVRDRMGDEESGGMSAYDITAVAVGAAHGLAYLEREKIVHGDFSADSIHLDEKGAAKIGDFGFQDTKKNIEKANASSFWFAKRAVANQNQVTPEPANPAELSSDPRADAAATSIQAAHRGAVARKTVAKMRDPAAQAAATTIQAAHRGAQARKDVAKMRDGGGPVSESFVSSGYDTRDADRVRSNGRSRRTHADARDARDARKTTSEGEGERNLFEAAVAGAVRWAGFGLGRVAPAAAASNRAGAVCEGKEAKNEEEEAEKAAWMAPELLKKGKKAKKTPASDVYALGMTLWQLYERRKPYGDAMAYEIKVRVLGGERPEFKSSSVPFKIKGIVECCLKEKPKTRPAATEVSFMIQEAAKEMKKPATKLVDKGIVKHEKKFT